MTGEAFTFDHADELKRHLEAYDAETELFDGRTAAESLKLVVHAAKSFGEPRIIFNSQDYRNRLENEDAQYRLF